MCVVFTALPGLDPGNADDLYRIRTVLERHFEEAGLAARASPPP